MSPIIETEQLTKTFHLRTLRATTLKETLLVNLWKPAAFREVHALEDVSFALEPGRTLGIVGSNGSGKSTLLRVLAGVIPPTAGTLSVRGRTGSLIDLAAGLQPELSGIENIFFNMSLLGVSRRDIRRRLSAVVDFAELGYYIHSPVKYYSSGMLVRLAFSIAVHLEPDLLLVDEALSVGDAYFQGKSLDRMRRLHQAGRTTILLVTHDLGLVEEICDDLVWLEKGRVRYCGPLAGGLDRLLLEHHRHAVSRERVKFSTELMHLLMHGRFGSGDAVIRDVRFLDRAGVQTCTFRTGEPFRVEADYEIVRPIEGMMLGVGIERHDGLTCTIAYAPDDLLRGELPARGTIGAVLDPFGFLPGRYRFSVGLLRPGRYYTDPYDVHLLAYHFRVIGGPGDVPARAAYRQEAQFSVTPGWRP